MNRTRTLGLLVSLSLAASEVGAGEGYVTYPDARPVVFQGYGSLPAQIYARPPIVLDFNQNVLLQGQWQGREVTRRWAPLSDPQAYGSQAELLALAFNTMFAAGLWENLPGCRVVFRYGTVVSFGQGTVPPAPIRVAGDGRSIVSLAGMPDSDGGSAGIDTSATITDMDIFLGRKFFGFGGNQPDPVGARAILAQELGHGLGFDHSWLTDWSVRSLTGQVSVPSVMAYGNGKDVPILRELLAPDDVALVCRRYPRLTYALSRTTGTVRGQVLSAVGTSPIFGANVLLIDRRTGAAVVSRISGYETTVSQRADSGEFSLDGVPPGVYDLLIAAWDDADVPTAGPSIEGQGGFARGFGKAMVTEIAVQAGTAVDLGVVRVAPAGSRVSQAARHPNLSIRWVRPLRATAEGNAEPLTYVVQVYRSGPAQIVNARVHGSGYRVSLPRGSYSYRVWAQWDGASPAFPITPWTTVTVD